MKVEEHASSQTKEMYNKLPIVFYMYSLNNYSELAFIIVLII